MLSRGRNRRFSSRFKLQLCTDIRSGKMGHREAQTLYELSGALIQTWLAQYDRGELRGEEFDPSLAAEYQAQIAALERKVGQLTMALDLLKKMPRGSIAPDSGNSLIVSGPPASPSDGRAK